MTDTPAGQSPRNENAQAPTSLGDGPIDPARITVTDNADESRFDITVGDTHVGFSMYLPTESAQGVPQRILYHTVVFEQFGGHGLAAPLTEQAIAQSVAAGYRVVAMCPYVKKWVTKHHEFDDRLDPVTPAHLALFG